MRFLFIAILLALFLSGCAKPQDKEVPSSFSDLSETEKACLKDLSLPYAIDVDQNSVKCLVDKDSVIFYPNYSFRDMPDSLNIKDNLIEVKTHDTGPQRKEVCIKGNCLEINYRKNGEFLSTASFKK